MRFLQFIATSTCSLTALLNCYQQADAQYQSTGYSGFGRTAYATQGNDFATSRPYQADSVASDHRSMSPDNWGSTSGPATPDPFAAPAFANPTNAAYPLQSPVQQYPNTNVPGFQPPATQQVDQNSNEFRRPSPFSGRQPFRPVDSQIRDPKDLPLAPTVPSSILDENDNPVDSPIELEPNLLPGDDPALDGPGNDLPNQLDLNPQPAVPAAPNAPNEFVGDIDPPVTQPNNGPVQGLAAPPAFSNVPQPYQTPEIFSQPPRANPQPAASGFGWGQAPGIFKRFQQAPVAQPQAGQPALQQPRPNPQVVVPPQVGSLTAPPVAPSGQFRPDVGQRNPWTTVRNGGNHDSGHKQYDFENKKKQYPPFSEILATGRYFASLEGQFLKPSFNGNSGSVVQRIAGANTINNVNPFDFDYELLPKVRFGFESKYGPGLEIDFTQLRTASVVDQFTGVAGTNASITANAPGGFSSSIATVGAGDLLAAQHTLNVETVGISVFKEVQLPITRINGLFGFQFANIAQQLDATATDAGLVPIGSLQSKSDIKAFGPRIRLEYFRPIGHTPLEFITTVGGSIMFGKRDQFINNSNTTFVNRVGVDEFVSTFEFMSGIQMTKRIGENRAVFGRVGFINQIWNSGGNAALPQDDFGLRGYSFLIGYNR